MATDWDKFFKEEKDQPSGWCAGKGSFTGVSVSSDLFSRDEKKILESSKKYGFIFNRNGGFVSFRQPTSHKGTI